MPDPLQRPPAGEDKLSLFDNTSRKAGEVAAKSIGKRHATILDLLRTRGPLCLFELAALMGVHDHQISGRITELVAARRIERTGQRRKKPETGCECDVYKLSAPIEPLRADQLGHVEGYPDALSFDGQIFDRQVTTDQDPVPGIPYVRRASGGGLAVTYRFLLVKCPTCGDPLRPTDPITLDGTPRKRFACPTCKRTYEPALTSEPGGPTTLALVLRTL